MTIFIFIEIHVHVIAWYNILYIIGYHSVTIDISEPIFFTHSIEIGSLGYYLYLFLCLFGVIIITCIYFCAFWGLLLLPVFISVHFWGYYYYLYLFLGLYLGTFGLSGT